MVSCLCFESETAQRMKVNHIYSPLVLHYKRGRVSDQVSLASELFYSLPRPLIYKRGRVSDQVSLASWVVSIHQCINPREDPLTNYKRGRVSDLVSLASGFVSIHQ